MFGTKAKSWMQVGSIILTIVAVALCLIDWFQVSGYKYGYFYGVFKDPPMNGFSADGPNYYQSINTWYFVISLCLLVFLSGKIARWAVASNIICIVALCVSIFPFWNMLDFKTDVLSRFNSYNWLSISIYLDWFCLVAIITLLFFEILLMISNKPLIETSISYSANGENISLTNQNADPDRRRQ